MTCSLLSLYYTLLKYAFYVQNNSPFHFTSRVNEGIFFLIPHMSSPRWSSVVVSSYRIIQKILDNEGKEMSSTKKET